ncbi:hypothetical protein F5050DRAFT_1811336 [Lentinula boryana]|uniref:WD40 repeat-like protein n=1 Tax=Lentinula boryana TaxID=40481 RepID=A0ABQ8Q2F4_9AGAR|nr:hypothetical protein F5050DRAFT_1811336 [Lentinula boryana]
MDNRFHVHRRFPLPYGPQDDVTALDFSSDGRYLAVGYGDGVDIWDAEDDARTSPVSTTRKHSERTHPALRCLAWIPHEPRLVLAHCRGIIYTINVNRLRKKFATAGIRADSFYEDGVSIAAIDKTLFVVAFTKTVQVLELRPGSEDTGDDLVLLGTLQSPPAAAGLDIAKLNVTGVFPLSTRHILVSYDHLVVVEWELQSAPFHAIVVRTVHIAGIIGGNLLVTNNAAGAYELHSWPTSKVPVSFVPREPATKLAQPIMSSQFLSHTCVVGGGLGQLIIWDTEATRLQTLKFHQPKNHVGKFCCVYKAQSDIAWIAAVGDISQQEVLLWEWKGNVTSDTMEPDSHHTEARSGHISITGNYVVVVIITIIGLTSLTLGAPYLLPRGALRTYISNAFW